MPVVRIFQITNDGIERDILKNENDVTDFRTVDGTASSLMHDWHVQLFQDRFSAILGTPFTRPEFIQALGLNDLRPPTP